MPVTEGLLPSVVTRVKEAAKEAAKAVIAALRERYPQTAHLKALSIVFPQFWAANPSDAEFIDALSVIGEYYCVPRATSLR